jgi:Ca2+-binding RTX toxin-like protein
MTKRKRTGTNGADSFFATREAELFQGLDGIDTVSYANSTAGVIVDIRGNTPGKGGAAEGDLYESIENLSGSIYRDTLFGSTGDNVLWGRGGHDRLQGFAGKDTLFGGDGNDQLRGGTEDDTLHGEQGDDVAIGNTGNDVLHGGPGFDILIGGAGNDTLYGGTGDDQFDGDGIEGTEADPLLPGADVYFFNLATQFGADSILGMGAEDRIEFNNVDDGIATQFRFVANHLLAPSRIEFFDSSDRIVETVAVYDVELANLSKRSLSGFTDETFSAFVANKLIFGDF